MRSPVAVLVPGLCLLVPCLAAAQDREAVAPAYSRDGFDFYSAPIQPAETSAVPHACEKQYGKHTEVQALSKAKQGYRCSVPTLSEPRLSTRLKEELALLDPELTETRRQNLTSSLVEKYQRLAQCPAGTEAYYDGSMYFCGKTYGPKELCPSGEPTVLDSEQVGCVVSTCPKGLSDLGAATQGKHPGCYRCPKGAFDPKETEAFHGALKGMPAEYQEVFCKVRAKP